jgi:hypothetical protein
MIMGLFTVATPLVLLAALGQWAPRPTVCSPVPFAVFRDTTRTFLVGVGTSDTVLTGPGAVKFGTGAGHWGRGAERPFFGQVVRVDRHVGGAAALVVERAFSKAGRREVVIVPWDYASDCQPVPWSRTARWADTTQPGFFRVRPRPESQWIDGRPVFDAYLADLEPYPHGLFFQHGYRGTSALKTSPSLTPEEYFELYAALPDYVQAEREPDRALTALTIWERAHPELARKYPAPEILDGSRRMLERRRQAVSPAPPSPPPSA